MEGQKALKSQISKSQQINKITSKTYTISYVIYISDFAYEMSANFKWPPMLCIETHRRNQK